MSVLIIKSWRDQDKDKNLMSKFNRVQSTQHTYLNVLPYLVDIITIVSEPLVDCSDATLTARVIVTNKVRAVLVNGIISEMHALFSLHVHG